MKKIFILLSIALVSLSARAKDDMPSLVSVRGECQTKVTPDRGSIVLTIRQKNAVAGVAAQNTQEKFNRVIAKLRKLSLKELSLQTQSFYLNEEFDYNNGKQTSRGFIASQSLEVETSEPTRLSEVLKLAAEEKVEDIGSLSTFPSAATLKKARENCLEEAFLNAKQKAERLVKASSQKLGPAVMIQEIFGSGPISPRPMMFAKNMAMIADAAPERGGEVVSKDTEIHVFADVQFELK